MHSDDTCWGPTGNLSRNEFICIPVALMQHTPPAFADIRAGHALKNAARPGMWDHAPVNAILPILRAFTPGRPPTEQRLWDHDHLAEAKSNLAIREPLFTKLDEWMEEHEDGFWQLMNSEPQNVNSIFGSTRSPLPSSAKTSTRVVNGLNYLRRLRRRSSRRRICSSAKSTLRETTASATHSTGHVVKFARW